MVGPSYRQFLREVDKELSWLSERPRPACGTKSYVPSCLGLYGCLPVNGGLPLPAALPKPWKDETDKRSLADILGSDVASAPHTIARRKRKLVSYHPPLAVFGDRSTEPLRLLGKDYSSLTSIIAAQAKNAACLRELLGLPEPCQPFYFIGSYYTARCKSWLCAEHQPKVAAAAAPQSLEERAFSSVAWNKAEPLSVPPVCSCREPNRIRQWVAALARCVELHKPEEEGDLTMPTVDPSSPTSPPPLPASPPPMPDSPPPTHSPRECSPPAELGSSGEEVASSPGEELKRLEQKLLYESKTCKSCGGLSYFPYSFIEVFLQSHMSNLHELQTMFPTLPENTDVFCDGPHVSATICCKSPRHEWECFKALSREGLTQAPIIYDVCSNSFLPGVPTRPGQKRSHEQEVPYRVMTDKLSSSPRAESPKVSTSGGVEERMDEDEPTDALLIEHFSSPLNPPPQRFLNCRKFLSNKADYQTITSLTARRPYCVSVRRNLENILELSAAIEREEEAADNGTSELEEALRKYAELRKLAKKLDQDLEALQMDSLTIEVTSNHQAAAKGAAGPENS